MTTYAIASRDTWLDARRDLLAAEKDLTRRADEVTRLRQALPWVKVEKVYEFEGSQGPLNQRPLRWSLAAYRAAFYAGRWLGSGLQELLLYGRSYRQHDGPSRTSRHRDGGNLTGAVCRNRAFPQAHGLEFLMGVFVRQRLQL